MEETSRLTTADTISCTHRDSSNIHYWLRDFWLLHADRRVTTHWLVRHGVLPSVAIVSLWLVLVLVVLPRTMAHRRPPHWLRSAMLPYNVAMCAVNVCFAVWALVQWRFGRDWFDLVAPSEFDTSDHQLAAIAFQHVYLWSKFLDLFDTLFTVLLKKPVTFLHVYHHSAVPLMFTVSFILHPSSTPAGIFAFFNSIVHSLIYGYLALATLGPSVRRHLLWKRYITQVEIGQFAIYSAFTALYYKHSQGYSMAYLWIAIFNNPVFIFLFIRFYLKTYLSEKPSNKSHKES